MQQIQIQIQKQIIKLQICNKTGCQNYTGIDMGGVSISGHCIGPSQMCNAAGGGIIAIGEGGEILVFISTNFFSHQGLIDPLLVLPPYLSHEYVSACFPQSCPSRLLRPWWGGSDNIGEVDTITEANSPQPFLSKCRNSTRTHIMFWEYFFSR